MSLYIVRVELHNAEGKEYQVLHAAMEGESFSRHIRDTSGKSYHLPWAEYCKETVENPSQVLTRAQRAAGKTGRAAAILVSQTTAVMLSGLTPA